MPFCAPEQAHLGRASRIVEGLEGLPAPGPRERAIGVARGLKEGNQARQRRQTRSAPAGAGGVQPLGRQGLEQIALIAVENLAQAGQVGAGQFGLERLGIDRDISQGDAIRVDLQDGFKRTKRFAQTEERHRQPAAGFGLADVGPQQAGQPIAIAIAALGPLHGEQPQQFRGLAAQVWRGLRTRNAQAAQHRDVNRVGHTAAKYAIPILSACIALEQK